jgi:hypothetical protein
MPENMSPMAPAEVIAGVCAALSNDRADDARALIATEYPHIPVVKVGRSYSKRESVAVFARDGYIDRYTGQRLVFPGTLRLLWLLLPAELPYHPHWTMEVCHRMWWDLFPTIDHVVPVARGGEDAEPNLVTTSMLRNQAKANWTLDELGWELLPPGDLAEWDGLTGWCVQYLADHSELAGLDAGLREWASAARRLGP